MEEREQISLRQFIYIIFISRAILGIAYGNVEVEKQDIIVEVFLSFSFVVLMMEVICAIIRELPNKTYIECSRVAFGKLGSVISLIYVIYFIYKDSVSFAMFNALISTAILPETPTIFLSITFIIAVVYGATKGLETIGRVAEIVGVIIIISIVSIFLLVYKDIDMENFLPLLERGPMPMIKGGTVVALRTLEVIFIAIIAPSLSDIKKIRKGYIIGFATSWVVFFIIIICIIGVFGVNQVVTKTFPYYSLVKFANAFNFVERIQAVHIGIWVLGAYIKITFAIYIMAYSLAEIFSLREYKPLILPIGLIMMAINELLVSRYVDIRSITLSSIDIAGTIFFQVIIPLIMLIIIKIKKCVLKKI